MTQLARIGGSTPQFNRWDDLLRDAAGDAGALLAALQQAPAADRAGLAARTLDALSDAQLSALAAQPRGAETLRALRDAAADAPAGAPGADARDVRTARCGRPMRPGWRRRNRSCCSTWARSRSTSSASSNLRRSPI